MPNLNRAMLVLVVLAGCVFLRDQARAEEPADLNAQAARQDRLAFIKQTFAEFELTAEGKDAFAATDEPVSRYSNPIRNSSSDGATFMWLDGRRPVAAGTISVRGGGDVWAEFSSFSERPLRCVRDGRTDWTPASGGLVGEPLPEAPDPAASPKLRPAQMRQLARRFEVTMSESEKRRDATTALRLLPNPVYAWSDEEAGVEGAVFAFIETTDPEAFVVLELATGADPAWRYSLARMTSRPLVFRLDDRDVLSVGGYWANSRGPEDAYAEQPLGRYEPPGGAAEPSSSNPPASGPAESR